MGKTFGKWAPGGAQLFGIIGTFITKQRAHYHPAEIEDKSHIVDKKLQGFICIGLAKQTWGFNEGREGVKWELGFAFFRGWEMGFCALGLGFVKKKKQ